jgi:hypothetical protein
MPKPQTIKQQDGETIVAVPAFALGTICQGSQGTAALSERPRRLAESRVCMREGCGRGCSERDGERALGMRKLAEMWSKTRAIETITDLLVLLKRLQLSSPDVVFRGQSQDWPLILERCVTELCCAAIGGAAF